jgi:hypothetical protein
MSCNFPDCIDGWLGSRLVKTQCPQCAVAVAVEATIANHGEPQFVVEAPVEPPHVPVNFAAEVGEEVPLKEKAQ